MNRIKRNRAVKFSSMSLALLSTMSLVSGGASAKEHKVKGSDNQADVVAHISFSGLSAVDMVNAEKSERHVLPLCATFNRPRHLDYRYHQARSTKSRRSNPVARSSCVEQGERHRRFGDYFRKRVTHSTSNDDLVLWGF